jgi:hypothetical protein
MLNGTGITLGGSRRRPVSRRKVFMALGAAALLFLALYRMPLQSREASHGVPLPAPREIK